MERGEKDSRFMILRGNGIPIKKLNGEINIKRQQAFVKLNAMVM
tara:strand:+ start:257 stop:388 length:132 start_codon:yes stop_codon:yes gene_type:complete